MKKQLHFINKIFGGACNEILRWKIKSVTKPDGWDFRNKEMQILKRELQMLCDEEKEMAREKTARQQLVIR